MSWTNKGIVLLFCLVSFNCNERVSTINISLFKEEFHKNNKNTSEISKILILSENGCPGCNKSFYKLITEQALNKKGVMIYSSSVGSRYDFSELYEDSIYNHILGTPAFLNQIGLNDETAYLELHDNQIDTIIFLKAESLDSSILYLQNRLSE